MGGLAKFGSDIAKNVFNVAYQASGCLIRSIALLGLLYLLAQVRMDRIAEDCAVLDRPRYAPVVSGLLGNLAEAHRRLGDEAAARACEAEAAALESGSNVSE